VQYRAVVTIAPAARCCSAAEVWAEQGRRQLDELRQDTAYSQAAPHTLENTDWGRDNGLALNQHSTRGDPPV